MKLRTLYLFGVVILLAVFSCQFAEAQLSVPRIIGSNMVLQQNTTVKLWGKADAGRKVSVKPSWQMKTVTVKADSNGNWIADVKTPEAGGPFAIDILSGKEKIHLYNVMTGEVWFCSGQSNMEFPVGVTPKYWHTGVVDYEKQTAIADYPNIRFFTVAQKTAIVPLDTMSGQWSSCTPVTVNNFSAVSYFFGQMLYQQLHVPIGLIHSSWGGTPAESWTRRDFIVNDTTYHAIFEREAKVLKDYDPKVYNEYLAKTKAWKEGVANGTITGKEAKRGPSEPWGPYHSKMPGVLYNGMVAPVIPYTIKGAIWYQGESNNDAPSVYASLFPALINNWRADWGLGDFPFYFVQISAHRTMTPELREAQFLTLSKLQNTGMAVTVDVGDSADIHPRMKQPVGERLALWALANTYQMKGFEFSGPLFKQAIPKDGSMLVEFTHVGKGLEAKGGELKLFEIAGADGKYVKAQAEIKGDIIKVWSADVPEPIYVRYAWSKYMVPDLFNKDGLPASPFRNKPVI